MKINDILVESKQEQLDELDIGKAAGAVARGAGKVVGGVAKGVGALAGVAGGVKRAFQTGKQAATDVIGGTGQGADAPRAVAQPAASTAAPTTQQINKAGPKGTAPAKAVSNPVAKQAMAKTAQAMSTQGADQAGQTLYAQVKASVGQLDKKGKQRILQLLQKSLQQPATAPRATPSPATGMQPAPKPTTAKRGQPVKVSGKPTARRQVQTAGKIDSRPSINESFSLYRKK